MSHLGTGPPGGGGRGGISRVTVKRARDGYSIFAVRYCAPNLLCEEAGSVQGWWAVRRQRQQLQGCQCLAWGDQQEVTAGSEVSALSRLCV